MRSLRFVRTLAESRATRWLAAQRLVTGVKHSVMGAIRDTMKQALFDSLSAQAIANSECFYHFRDSLRTTLFSKERLARILAEL